MTRTFCVFEGGGAKGVAHVGVLKAIEDMNEGFVVEGYAGTSAGAIVAALAAAGWRSDELIARTADGGIHSPALQEVGEGNVKSLAEIFGREWTWITWARDFIRSISNGTKRSKKIIFRASALIVFIIFWPIFALAIPDRFGSQSQSWLWSAAFTYLINPLFWTLYGILVAVLFGFAVYVHSFFTGVATLDFPMSVIDKLLSKRVTPSNGKQVTFRDIKEQRGVDLKIVASNIDSGVMVLFDHEDHPDVPVSLAVAASAAIPFVFKPVEIDGFEYCDGGLVSNLPAWTFDSSRVLDDDCLVVTCELSAFNDTLATPSTQKRPAKKGVKLMESVMKTTIFGASDLNTRGLQQHIKLPLQTRVSLLDFELTAEQMESIENCSQVASDRLFIHWMEQQSLHDISAAVRDYFGAAPGDNNIRTALVREIKMVNRSKVAFQPWYTDGFDGHLDRRIMLPVADSLVGRSIASKTTRLLDFREPGRRDEYYSLHIPNAGSALPDNREWFFVMPFNREDNLEGTGEKPNHLSVCLTIDGSTALSGDPSKLQSDIRDIASNRGIFTPY